MPVASQRFNNLHVKSPVVNSTELEVCVVGTLAQVLMGEVKLLNGPARPRSLKGSDSGLPMYLVKVFVTKMTRTS
jgi:hypothetical protein